MKRAIVLTSIVASLVLHSVVAPAGAAEAEAEPDADAPSLSLPGADTALEVKGESDADSEIVVLQVFNGSAEPITPDVQLEGSAPAGVSMRQLDTDPVQPIKAVPIRLEFSGLADVEGDHDEKVRGQLVVTGGNAPLLRAVTITPGPQPLNGLPWTIVILFTAFAASSLMYIAISRRCKRDGDLADDALKTKAPTMTFKLNESWATNLTVIGALLGTTIAGVTYPDVPRQISKDNLVQLGLLFAGLVTAAPFISQAIRGKAPTQEKLRTLTGTNRGLAIAYSVVFGAVVAEVICLGFLAGELIDENAATVAIVIAVGIFVRLAISYTYHGVGDFLARDWKGEAEEAAAEPPKPESLDGRREVDEERSGVEVVIERERIPPPVALAP